MAPKPSLFLATDTKPYKIYVEIHGIYQKSDSHLIINSSRIPVGKNGRFTFRIEIKGNQNYFKLIQIDSSGNALSQSFLLVTNWSTLTQKIRSHLESKKQKKLTFSGGLGHSLIFYQETNIEDFFESALTVKLAAAYSINPKWRLSSNIFYTLFPLFKSSPETLQFLGFNLRGGYNFQLGSSPWTLGIQGGGYYTTTFVSDNTFGFINQAGPQIFLTVKRDFSKDKFILAYTKLSLVSSQLFEANPSSYEVAGGLVYPLFRMDNHRFSFALDLAKIHLEIGEVEINSTSFSMAVDVSF
jgi:hypothetical protein